MTSINRFAPDEIYHCYNRGVDRRITFTDHSDYKRFMELLFLCNDKKMVQRSSLNIKDRNKIYSLKKDQEIVLIGAYCLMPNHFHILIKEIVEGGISLFMNRLGNSYTKYFNIKYKRNGNLFIKPFSSKHVGDDGYFSHIAQYIHLNPIELFEPGWKDGNVRDIGESGNLLGRYPYGSLPDYLNSNRQENSILNKDFVKLLSEDLPSLSNILQDAAEYYHNLET